MSHLLAAAIFRVLDECDRCLNDPAGDGSGSGAVPPTGDHYNALQQILRTLINEHREPATGSPALLRALLESNPALLETFASAGYRFGQDQLVRHALDEIVSGAHAVVVPFAHFKALTDAASAHHEDLASGLREGFYTDGADTLAPLKEALAFASHALKQSPTATADYVIIEAFGRPFDPAKVHIVRHRRSTTQGEVEVFYDGERIAQWGDHITLRHDGQFEGYPDTTWIDAARRWRVGQAIQRLRGVAA